MENNESWTERGFAIRTPLDQRGTDMVLNANMTGLLRNIPEIQVKNILWFGLMAVFDTFLFSSQWFLHAGLLMQSTIIITLLIFTWYFFGPSNTGILGVYRFVSAINFSLPNRKKIRTRLSDEVDPFEALCNITNIDDQGRLLFFDGTQGYIYEVVGNASRLMFDSYKANVLNSVRQFWRQDFTGISFHFITKLSGERVTVQLQHKDEQLRQIPKNETTLREMQLTKQLVLRDRVGNNSAFKTIRQYMVVKAKDGSRINNVEDAMRSNMKSGLFLRSFRQLSRSEAEEVVGDYLKATRKS